jgi:hypothetical protein
MSIPIAIMTNGLVAFSPFFQWAATCPMRGHVRDKWGIQVHTVVSHAAIATSTGPLVAACRSASETPVGAGREMPVKIAAFITGAMGVLSCKRQRR